MTDQYEKKQYQRGYKYIIGCDEVGRGSLAGPVVACAVIMEHKTWNMKQKIRDSKLLNPNTREELSKIIRKHARWSIGIVSQNTIDEINIHNATLLAMQRAVKGLTLSLDSSAQDTLVRDDNNGLFIAVDGRFIIPNLDVPQEAIIDGDNKVLSIAAASIIAKVYRDRIMTEHHQNFPLYNFAQHKGYGTLYHRQMIINHGLSPLHRLSFCEDIAV
ncbi:MAG: ribonuclease HII [Candidatus Doudnabacteria bacterium]|nr:ribonuclease HII [Candidatus Doudnabacteria bacterium]